jgi:hypothetical protein
MTAAAEEVTMDDHDDLWTHEDMTSAAEEIGTALPVVLAGEAEDLEAVDRVFGEVLSRLSPVEAESMGSALQTIGRWAGDRERLGQIAGAVLPTAATALGTVYGGPIGGALAGSVSQRAVQAIAGRAPQPAAPAAPAPAPAAAPPVSVASGPAAAATPAPGANGSQAAAQLLYLAQNPAFLSSLVALALGSKGQSTVPVGTGGQQAPLGAFMTLASSLAGKAAEDADTLLGGGESLSESYLRDETGCFTCDPAVPAQRAAALLRLLQQEDETAASVLGQSGEDDWRDDLDGEWWQDEW